MLPLRLRSTWTLGSAAALALVQIACSEAPSNQLPSVTARFESLEAGSKVAWARTPPAGLFPQEVPQFVAITYDDNFVPNGMEWAAEYHKPLVNPPGNGTEGTFDAAPVLTSFYHTSIYIDGGEANLNAWKAAFELGHEAADHTRNHGNGTNYTLEDWVREISECKSALTHTEWGIGASKADVVGFRTPYLAYNRDTFSALASEGFRYDTSIQNCWADDEDGTNCSFPYQLDQGSPDADTLVQKFANQPIDKYAGLWEVPVSALVVPSDSLAEQYGFEKGLRSRIPTEMPYPSFFEQRTGKIAPLDITLFVDARLRANEVLAILKYNLDLHLNGNRAPLVFVAHTHVYAADYLSPENAPSSEERREAIESFARYALEKPDVRMRPVKDIVAWMENPVPLTGQRTVDAGAADAGDAADSGTGLDHDASPADSDSGNVSSDAGTAGQGGTRARASRRSPSSSSSCQIGMDGATSSGTGWLLSLLLGVTFARWRGRARNVRR